MKAIAVLLAVSIAIVSASVGVHHHHTHLNAPLQMDLEMDEDKLAEELGSQQKIQVSAGLSDVGPLTRADYGGEKPYEVMELDDDDESSQKVAPVAPVVTASDPSSYEEIKTVDEAPVAEIETVPRLLPDGRLVRIPIGPNKGPITITPAQSNIAAQIDVPKPVSPPLVAPDVDWTNEPAKAPETSASGSPVTLELLSLNEGTGATAAQAEAVETAQRQMAAIKKVRVSSLVSGILSSVLSSVLTRGMHFESARGF